LISIPLVVRQCSFFLCSNKKDHPQTLAEQLTAQHHLLPASWKWPNCPKTKKETVTPLRLVAAYLWRSAFCSRRYYFTPAARPVKPRPRRFIRKRWFPLHKTTVYHR
jgi:hypothetical protein